MKKIFFHLGYPKTGTTFLQRHLFTEHPEIHNVFSNSASEQNEGIKLFLKSLVEMDNQQFDNSLNILKEYVCSLDLSTDKINLISYEVFTSGIENFEFNLQITFERIKTIFSGVDIECNTFITIRRQSQYIVSRYAQGSIKFESVKKDWSSFNYFIKYFEAPETRDDTELKFFNGINYYDTYMGLSKVFGPNHVKVFVYEKLKKNQNEFIQDLSRYLGVDYDDSFSLTSEKIENIAKRSKRGLYERKYTSNLFFLITENNLYKKLLAHITPVFLKKFFKILLEFPDFLIKVFRKPFLDDIILSAEQNELIKKYYSKSNKKLNEKLDLKLDEMGYF